MINSINESQLAYLKEKGKFTIPCKYDHFPEKVIELLKNYGHLYEALSNGIFLPINKEQEQFIEVAHMKRTPKTDDEWAWFFCVKRKKIEDDPALYNTPILKDDSFYSREMAKNDQNSVYNIRKKNDEK
jgi:uncharacterized protein